MRSMQDFWGARLARRTGFDRRRPASRRRRGDGWGVEVLEGRALLSTYYLVDSPGDAGVGTGIAGDLRYAIEQADRSPGDSTIVFSPGLDGQTIALSSGPLVIDKPSGTLTIHGPGAAELALSGGHQAQILSVSSSSRVTISGLTMTDGISEPVGAIANQGQLTLSACTISGNTVVGGGGGGAITNAPLGTLTISDSTISGNVAVEADGGGISNAGSMTIMRSTISGNASRGGNGGGLTNTGVLTIGDSTISGNRALYGTGGGLINTGSVVMTDDTVAGNTAGDFGGGLANEGISGGTLTLDNSIVAGNVSGMDAATSDILDNGDSARNRMVGSADLIQAGDVGGLTRPIVGVNPQLGPLQNNGGPTWTQALLAGSPAINAGDNALVPSWATTDQRGGFDARISGGRVDLGAFEYQVSRPFNPSVSRQLPGSSVALIGLTIVPTGPTTAAAVHRTDAIGG